MLYLIHFFASILCHSDQHCDNIKKDNLQKAEWKQIQELNNCDANIDVFKKEIGFMFSETERIEKLSEIILPQCNPLPKQGDLESNLDLANELLLYTRNVVVFSANNLDRSRAAIEEQIGKPIDNFTEITSKAWKCLASAQALALANELHSNFMKAKLLALSAKTTSIGNCRDMSSVALFKAMEMGIWNTHVDLAYINPGNHMVVVIGREAESNPHNHSTWGENAVILDAWAGKYFKLGDVNTKLLDWEVTSDLTGEPKTVPFDSSKKLVLQTGNIPTAPYALESLNQVKEKRRLPYLKLIQELAEFNQAKELNIKLIKARVLLDLCENQQDISYLSCWGLKDQLIHFIGISNQWCKNAPSI